MRLADAIAFLVVGVFGLKRRRTMTRLREVFPEKSGSELRRIAIKSFANLLKIAIEMMRAPKFDRAWMDRHVHEGEKYRDLLKDLIKERKGVVIMVPHTGNWYMAAWAMAKYSLPLFAIAARQRNPKIDAWINRQYTDIEVLDRDCRDTLVKIKAKIKSGGAFAILPDLRVRKKDVVTQFLRGQANVSHAGAMFAVKCGSPIVVAAMSRENGKHVFNYFGTLHPKTELKSSAEERAEAERLTREVLTKLSDFILKHPEEWFWYNKRWIHEPAENT